MEPTLIGHWQLAGDADDASGNGLHGQNQGADLQAPGPTGQATGATAFDGRSSSIVVPHDPALQTVTHRGGASTLPPTGYRWCN